MNEQEEKDLICPFCGTTSITTRDQLGKIAIRCNECHMRSIITKKPRKSPRNR